MANLRLRFGNLYGCPPPLVGESCWSHLLHVTASNEEEGSNVSSARMRSEEGLVSVILAVRNERNYVEDALRSLIQQNTEGFEMEILVIDGKSSDGTGDLVRSLAQEDARIRILTNEHGTTPFAFNLGLEEARGCYVCILGSHALYERDYVRTCMSELLRTGASACGGLVETWPANNGLQARLVAWVLSHSFGSSTKSFRTRKQGFTDGVNFPLAIKQALLDVGKYDVQLTRNQDNDMNQRLRSHGHRLYITEKTKCRYFVKADLKSLFQYAFRSGLWNVLSFRKNRKCMGLRHFVPFAFVAATVATLFMLAAGLWFRGRHEWMFSLPFLLLVGAHLLSGTFASILVALRERSIAPLILPIVFLTFHISYGAGSLWGLSRPPMKVEA